MLRAVMASLTAPGMILGLMVSIVPLSGLSGPARAEPIPRPWAGAIAARVNGFKDYPYMARMRQKVGALIVGFQVGPDGQLLKSWIERSSCDKALDHEALDLLQRASPFPPAPPGYKRASTSFRLPLVFAMRGREVWLRGSCPPSS
ncbi:TonB family protein [Bradyrhizobium prioriisuperbiae]|uniref:energy transducer TonB family protein n=1 Tax=Bradyrhizobium prioriisuperbiae TaxID=2854389 RepID=UPI0028E7E98D|nr:TonB family protein [Bradyrhizobium prioritasuperba]